MPDYPGHWDTLFRRSGTEGVDLISSLTEQAVNAFLAKHFEADNRHYSKTVEKEFNDGTRLRRFSLTLEVGSALKIDFPPFAAKEVFASGSGWNDVDHRLPSERGTLVTPNVRLTCDSVRFKIKWPRLHIPPPEWEWIPNPLSLVAEAYLWLDHTEGRNRLMFEPTKIKFDTANLRQNLALTAENECETKFNELLIIGLNVAAYEFSPSLIRAIEIPGFNIQGLPIYPAYLDMSNDIVTIGASVDRPKAEQQIKKAIEPTVSRYLSLLAEDLDAFSKSPDFFSPDGTQNGRHLTEKQVEKILSTHLVRSRGYVKSVLAQQDQFYSSLVSPKLGKARGVALDPVANGIAVGLDEYFVDSLLPRFFNARREGLEEIPLGVVKGGIRWWFQIANPDADFQGTDIVGSADIDIGAAIFACVRKFWDCSWRWECGEISLGVTGRPTVRLVTSNVDSGIALRAQIEGRPDFTNNLPYPFDQVVNAVGDLVKNAIIGIIKLILSAIVIVIVSVEIAIPDMKTKLRLSSFSRFAFQRHPTQPVALPPNKRKFLGVTATVEART